MAKKTEKKAKKQKPQQMKIAGTERRDRIEAIETAAEAYREARDSRMDMAEVEAEEQQNLANVLQKHGVTEYSYEGEDGKPYTAYIPTEAKAKVRRVKEPKVPKAE